MSEVCIVKFEGRENTSYEPECVQINQYPWYKSGLKQKTEVRLRSNEAGIILHVLAFDVHSSANVIETNGSVHLDSCFEFFFRPENTPGEDYVNLEVNCIGTIHMGVHKAHEKRILTELEISEIQVRTSLPSQVIKRPNVDDDIWELEIYISFAHIERIYGTCDRDLWYVNFYRCGGLIEDQYAVWNWIDAPEPAFHKPLQFGRMRFS